MKLLIGLVGLLLIYLAASGRVNEVVSTLLQGGAGGGTSRPSGTQTRGR